MAHQSELRLENNLIKQLIGLGYQSVKIAEEAALLVNIPNPFFQYIWNNYFSPKQIDINRFSLKITVFHLSCI